MTKKEPQVARSVRTRALIHMQRMLATSAAAIAVGDTACHTGNKTNDAGSDATAFGPPAIDGVDAAVAVINNDTPDANVVVSERNHGYAVVDPMPRPAHCPDVAAHMKATASKSGDNIVVRVDNAGGFSNFKYDKTQKLLVYGGTYVKHSLEANGTMVVTLKPDATGSASVSLKGTCSKGAATISVYVASDLTTSVSEY
jgi:hypothetical protein